MPSVINDHQARKHLAANLRSRLDDLGMSQADLGRATQLPGEKLEAAKQRVYRYANAVGSVDGAHHLANIAEALGVSIDWLLRPPRKAKHAS